MVELSLVEPEEFALDATDIAAVKTALRAAANRTSYDLVLASLANKGVDERTVQDALGGKPVPRAVGADMRQIARVGLYELKPEETTQAVEVPGSAQVITFGPSPPPFQVVGEEIGREIGRVWTRPVGHSQALEILAAGRNVNWLPDELNAFFEMMDSRHAIVTLGNRVVISERHQDGSVTLHTERDLKLKYRPHYREDVGDRGGMTRVPLFDLWLLSTSRPEYNDGLTFAPGGCSERQLNLWTGWGVKPNPTASCDLFLAHLRDIICGNECEAERYALGWLAHLVQRPWEKPGVGLVLRGAKGTGKDTFGEYVAKMIGHRHAPAIGEEDHLIGKFNVRFETALLVLVQEATWAGSRRGESVLKYLVTSERIEVERKGVDSYQVPSVLRLILTANADWVVPASADERRWCVLDVSDAQKQATGYFAALRAEMDGEGPAALLHYLQGYDLSGFDVRRAPRTAALMCQKLASQRGFDLWWSDILHEGRCAHMDDAEAENWEHRPMQVKRAALREQYEKWTWQKRHENDAVGSREFGRKLREAVPGLGDAQHGTGAGRWHYVLPPLSECRAAMEAKLGGQISW